MAFALRAAPCVRVRCSHGPRSAVAPKAAHTRRDAMQLGLLAIVGPTFAGLAGARNAGAAGADLQDHRVHKSALDSLDQARDDSADARDRFSMQDVNKLSLDEHRARAAESVQRLQSDVKTALDKKSWLKVSADLRHQMGTLRYDLQTLINAKGDKQARKQGMELHDKAMNALSELDFYARKNKASEASESFKAATDALQDVVAFCG